MLAISTISSLVPVDIIGLISYTSKLDVTDINQNRSIFESVARSQTEFISLKKGTGNITYIIELYAEL